MEVLSPEEIAAQELYEVECEIGTEIVEEALRGAGLEQHRKLALDLYLNWTPQRLSNLCWLADRMSRLRTQTED